MPKGTGLILEVLTETSLGLGRVINAQAHRPFASVVPMMWLFTRKISARLKLQIQDFVHACYLPAKARLLAGATTTLSFQDLLPWEGSAILGAMTHKVLPAHQIGIPAFGGALTQTLVPCTTYAAQVQQDAIAWLATEQTEAGTPLSTVYTQELQMAPLTVARFMIYQEMLRAGGPEIPAPSLTGTYLALRGTSILGHVLGGTGGASGRSGSSATGRLKGSGPGAVTGLGRGIGNELEQLINGITVFLKPAVFLTWWAPYIFGIINMVLLGLFPFVLLWSLTPGQQFRPILIYFAVLFVTSATPLWWALVDIAARLGGSLDIDMMTLVPQWLEAAATRLVITVVGIFVVLATMSVIVLWTGFAAVRGIFRAAVAYQEESNPHDRHPISHAATSSGPAVAGGVAGASHTTAHSMEFTLDLDRRPSAAPLVHSHFRTGGPCIFFNRFGSVLLDHVSLC